MNGTTTYAERLAVLDEIRASVKSFDSRSVRGTVSIRQGETTKTFELIYSYGEDVAIDENQAGLMVAFPAINFTLFSRKFVLDFPASGTDLQFIRKLVETNNREVFINKIARRRYPFFREEYLPTDADITPDNSRGITEVSRTSIHESRDCRIEGDEGEVAVLSSGGKESLLTYGMLSELGSSPHSFFFNESGSHWFTAATSYRDFSSRHGNVHKVWSNVDRLYRFFLRNLEAIDQKVMRSKTDTYPVQLFIFPVYIMSLIPLAKARGITSVVLGDEFDDPREMVEYMGIRHYYGIYDQTHDFNDAMGQYLTSKMGNFRIWSAVYPVSGSVVEKALVSRYGGLFRLQRSCHSCRSIQGEMVPCGKCSKCLGIMMFVLAAGGNPADIKYSRDSIDNLAPMVAGERMRLDGDELKLMKQRLGFEKIDGSALNHVDGIHVLPDEEEAFQKVPETFRDGIRRILAQYAGGVYRLENGQWKEYGALQKNSDSVEPTSS